MMLYTRQYWANNSPNNFGMGQVRQRVSTGRAKNFPISSVIFTFHILSFQRGWKLQPRVPALLLSTILDAGLRRPKGQQGISFCRLTVYDQDSDNQKKVCHFQATPRHLFNESMPIVWVIEGQLAFFFTSPLSP